MAQKYTSANTSVNSVKLPAICSKVSKRISGSGQRVLDYGCGKYTEHIRKFFEDLGCQYYGYDKYWNDDSKLLEKKYDIAICSNVLNVIDDDEEVKRIAEFLTSVADYYFITVYEGDKSGIGKQSQKDAWQRNAVIRDYLAFFPGAHVINSMITNI